MIIKSLKTKKSTSLDQLDNYAIKLVADRVAAPLHHVITLSILQEKFPSEWKKAKIFPLFKKGSEVHKENYHPVSILSPLSRVLEKLVYSQIYDYFEKHKLFSSSLHGYRQNRSTLTALLCLYDKWITVTSNRQIPGIVLVDLSAAFNLGNPQILLKKLKIYIIQDEMLNWIQRYLTDREQTVWIDHIFIEFLSSNLGVPQGSNLGPLFSDFFVPTTSNYINESIESYADDSTLSASGSKISFISNRLSEDCSNLSGWM